MTNIGKICMQFFRNSIRNYSCKISHHLSTCDIYDSKAYRFQTRIISFLSICRINGGKAWSRALNFKGSELEQSCGATESFSQKHTHTAHINKQQYKNKGNRLSVILIKSFSKVLCLLPKPSDRINDLWAGFDSNKFLVQALIKTRDYNL